MSRRFRSSREVRIGRGCIPVLTCIEFHIYFIDPSLVYRIRQARRRWADEENDSIQYVMTPARRWTLFVQMLFSSVRPLCCGDTKLEKPTGPFW